MLLASVGVFHVDTNLGICLDTKPCHWLDNSGISFLWVIYSGVLLL